jgi:hypothetical protein
MDVIAETMGVTTFVASSRPPRPTSRTARATPASRNRSNATAVVHSKNVGGVSNVPVEISDSEDAADGVLQLAAIDHHVEHAVLEQELAALKALGELLTDRLLDDPRAGKADERLRLGDVHVAEHGEARRHAAGRRIGQHRDVGEPGAIEPRQGRADLRHLHERERALPSCARRPSRTR